MQEKQKIVEAWFGVGVIVIAVGAFLILNKSNESVSGEQPNTVATDTLVYESELLQNHVDKLASFKGTEKYDELKKQADAELVKTIEEKTAYTPTESKPFMITNNISEEDYKKQFGAAFAKATSSGMGLEIVYFISQMSQDGSEILPLSPSDTESIYRVATEYEIFADDVQKIPTPPNLTEVGEVSSGKAREVAFYLRKMMEEKDPFVYSAFFTKYIEATSFILKINNKPSAQLSELEQIKALASSTEVLLYR